MKLEWLRSRKHSHEDGVSACTWVPSVDKNPGLLLTGSIDETVKLWNPEKLSLVRTNIGHRLGVLSVAAHPSGKIVASASMDSLVRVFDVESNKTIATLETPTIEVWQMQFDPEGLILAVTGGSSRSVKLLDTSDWKLIETLSIPRPESSNPCVKGNHDIVLSVAWSPNGKQLACGLMDGSISVFDVERAKFLHHLDGHTMPVRSLSFSPSDSKILVSGSDDKSIHMYDAKRKTLLSSMSGHSSWVLSVDVSPDGAAIVSGSSDKTVKLWDPKMRAVVQTMTTHKSQVWGVKFEGVRGGVRGSRLATVSDDKSISLYSYS